MHFSTLDACYMLYCWRIVKPLFYGLHQVETVGLWVWIPFMTCLGWWAVTTRPPRIPPGQGCEHLSVMTLFQKCNAPKKITKILWRMRQIFIEFHLVFESGISNKKIDQVLHWFRTWDLFDTAFGRCYWLIENHVIFPKVDELILTRLACNLWIPLIPKGVFGANRPFWCQG